MVTIVTLEIKVSKGILPFYGEMTVYNNTKERCVRAINYRVIARRVENPMWQSVFLRCGASRGSMSRKRTDSPASVRTGSE